MAVIGIIVFCGVVVGAAALLLNRPGHPKDPREDEEQLKYLREWSEKHGKANRKDYEDSGMNPDQAAEAAEKDTPMEPIRTEEGFCYTETYKCPRCSKEFQGTGIARYCYHCGQRLKWEE